MGLSRDVVIFIGDAPDTLGCASDCHGRLDDPSTTLKMLSITVAAAIGLENRVRSYGMCYEEFLRSGVPRSARHRYGISCLRYAHTEDAMAPRTPSNRCVIPNDSPKTLLIVSVSGKYL